MLLKFLVAMPTFRDSKGFNHPTVLVKAANEHEAAIITKQLYPNRHIGDIKQVGY